MNFIVISCFIEDGKHGIKPFNPLIMSMIRDKKLKNFHSDSRNTIDQIHSDIINKKTKLY